MVKNVVDKNKISVLKLSGKRFLFLGVLITLVLCLNLASATTTARFTEDLQKIGEKELIEQKEILTKYGTYELTEKSWIDLFGWFEKVTKEVTLENNTETCSNDCMAVLEIDLKEKGKLVEEVLFKRSFDNQKTWVDWNSFVNWNIKVEEDVDIYETRCVQGKEIIDDKNGTSYFEQDCQEIYVRTEKQYKPLDYNKDYEIGIYKIKLDGSKKGSTVLDWLIKTDGVILDEWAIWGNISAGDEAEVILNSPEDGELIYTNEVILNATGNVTGEATLVNATLYDNSTGTWGTRNNTLKLGVLSYDNHSSSLKTNLKAYWKFDNNDFTDSHGSYDGTNQGTTNTSGIIRDGRYFTGTEYIDNLGASGITPTQDVSVSAWIKISSYPTTQDFYIVSKNGNTNKDWLLVADNTENISFIVFEGNDGYRVSAPSRISLNEWHHILGTWDDTSNTISIYIDGFLNNTEVYGITRSITTENVIIGRKADTADHFFEGSMDEVAIWNRALTENEVSEIYGNRLNSSSLTFTNTYSTGDNILWNMQFCDSDGDCGFATENYTFSIDSGSPQIDLSYPTALINYGAVNGTLELNFTATDDNLDSVWYDYNGTNVIIEGAVSGEYNQSNITLSTKKNVTIYANDTVGNLNSSTFSWDYKVFETGQEYETEVYETQLNNFGINVTYNPLNPITATLNYDGVNYTSSNSGIGSSGVFTSQNLNAPLINSSENKTFYWILTFNGNVIETSETNQTLSPLVFVECNATYTQTALNFTFWDELTNEIVNGATSPTTIKTNFNYWLGNGGLKKEYAFQELNSSENNYLFCISVNETIKIDLDMQYETSNHAERTFYFREHNISNETQDILLYNILSTEAIKFEVSLREGTSEFQNSLVEVWKYFVGLGEYKKVMVGLTDDRGTFVANLDLDQTYNFKPYKDGESYGTHTKQAMCDATPCEIEFNIEDLSVEAFEEFYDYFAQNVVYDLDYNMTTKIITLDFEDTTGTAQYWRLYVYKSNFKNESIETICDEYSYSTEGVLTCNYTNYTGSVFAKVYISRSPEKLVEMLNIIIENAPLIFGISAILASIIIILIMIFAGAKDPTIALVMLPFILLAIKLLGFIPISWTMLGAFTAFIFWLIKRVNT